MPSTKNKKPLPLVIFSCMKVSNSTKTFEGDTEVFHYIEKMRGRRRNIIIKKMAAFSPAFK